MPTLSLTDEVGKPYAIPISPVVDEAYPCGVFPLRRSRREVGAAGEKPAVCLSAVSYAAAIPNEFSMAMPRRCFMAVRRWSPMKRSR